MIIQLWHKWLQHPQYEKEWHVDEIADELDEYFKTMNLIDKVKEAADVTYVYTRAKCCGHTLFEYPLSKKAYMVGVLVMIPKFTWRHINQAFSHKRIHH